MGQLFSTFSLGNEDVNGVIIDHHLYTEKDDFYSVKAQISGVKKLDAKKTVELSFYNEILGKNSGNGSGAVVSIWYNF